MLQNTITITPDSFEQLKNNDCKVNLVSFDNVTRDKLSQDAQRFIMEGEDESLELHKRYKMTKRVNWYHVPSIWSSEAIFCKRSHLYPKVLLNQANVLVTDSFYRLVCKEEFNIRSLVFSFYNSITMVLAELEGRYYGGGVLELIPTEFKRLLIPYSNQITQEQYDHLEALFNSGASIDEILNYTDPILLVGISDERIRDLREIRNTLVKRCIKSKEIEFEAV